VQEEASAGRDASFRPRRQYANQAFQRKLTEYSMI